MITVFGSINLDIAIRTERFPGPGETLLGGEVTVSPGGKGANQAHAACRFGVPARLFGTVGADSFAAAAMACLHASEVDVDGVRLSHEQKTGLALITVNARGENAILVAPGANGASLASQVTDATLRLTRVLLMQLEVPPGQCAALARRARNKGCTVILNASPMPADGQVDLSNIDILIVNEIELAQFAHAQALEAGDNETLARQVAARCALTVLVTLGGRGALLFDPDGNCVRCPAFPVEVLDTTGAGDTFAGVFAAALADNYDVAAAMDAAAAAAALACTARGAQMAQPDREAIEAIRRERGLMLPHRAAPLPSHQEVQ